MYWLACFFFFYFTYLFVHLLGQSFQSYCLPNFTLLWRGIPEEIVVTIRVSLLEVKPVSYLQWIVCKSISSAIKCFQVLKELLKVSFLTVDRSKSNRNSNGTFPDNFFLTDCWHLSWITPRLHCDLIFF